MALLDHTGGLTWTPTKLNSKASQTALCVCVCVGFVRELESEILAPEELYYRTIRVG